MYFNVKYPRGPLQKVIMVDLRNDVVVGRRDNFFTSFRNKVCGLKFCLSHKFCGEIEHFVKRKMLMWGFL